MNRDDYLAELAERLPLPEPQLSEVLEELAAHLGDGVADLVAHGHDVRQAEAEMLRRLGTPDDLARGLLRARQTRGQLVAAAGAGVFAGVRTGIGGAVAGWLLVGVAVMLAGVVLQALRPALGLPIWSGWTPGWNSVITGAGLAIGAAYAGAAAVRVVAVRSWRPVAEVRLAVALIGAVLIGYVALVPAEQSLNWASVLMYLAVPAAFLVGAGYERIGPPRWRYLIAGMTAVVTIGIVAGAAGGVASRGGPDGGYAWDATTHGYEVIAPWWAEPGSPNADIVSSESGSGTQGIDSVSIEGTSAAALAAFSDYRLEAWRAQAPQEGWALIPGQTAPFATAPATLDGATVSGTIAYNREPGVDWAQVVLTATGPDGHRYLLWASSPEQTEFYGSVWAWFAALGH